MEHDNNVREPAQVYYGTNQAISNSTETYTTAPTFQNKIQSYVKSKNKWKKKLYGDSMEDKDDCICQITSLNINCIGVNTNENYKINTLREWLFHNNVDICGLQEVGVAEHMLKRHEKLAERLRDMRRNNMRISTTSNRHETIDKFQYGGTALFAYDNMAQMVRASGSDNTGLVRWSFLQMEGHRNRKVRMISAYNPCRTPTHHYATVYSQQKRYYNENKQYVCPRKKFRRDLCEFITSCQNDGESIILLIDCNENLTKMND